MDRTAPATPLLVLVAEDEAIVSLLIETELGDAGFEVAGPFASCTEASQWLLRATPDAAVLDLNLKDGPCTDVAAMLLERGVPFVVLTGADTREIPDVLQSAPLITKPSDLSRISKVIQGLVTTKVSAAQ